MVKIKTNLKPEITFIASRFSQIGPVLNLKRNNLAGILRISFKLLKLTLFKTKIRLKHKVLDCAKANFLIHRNICLLLIQFNKLLLNKLMINTKKPFLTY